eukprot:Platyproteum_vivax@DN2585_c0_g1_i1.p2
MYKELEESREAKETAPPETVKQGPTPVLNSKGEVRQCNEGKWQFRLFREADHLLLELEIPRYLDTSLLDIDINPTYIRCVVKGKVFQLLLDLEVKPDSSKVQRCLVCPHAIVAPIP